MEAGESISLTDGDGGYGEAVITDPHKKKCRVEVKDILTSIVFR